MPQRKTKSKPKPVRAAMRSEKPRRTVKATNGKAAKVNEAVSVEPPIDTDALAHPAYNVNTETLDPLDPGSILYHAIVTEQQRLLDSAQADAQYSALTDLLRLIAGGPRGERMPRAFVQFQGRAFALAGELRLLSPDGKYSAAPVKALKPLPLRPVAAMIASGRGGDWDVTDGTGTARAAANAFGTERVRVGFSRDEHGGMPGLLWEMPSSISIRLTEVRTPGGPALPWKLVRNGRIYVPPQPAVELSVSDGLEWVEFVLPVRSGEWDYVGALRSGVVEFAVRCDEPGEEFLAPPAGSLSDSSVDFDFDGTIEQPYDGTPGECGEADDAWRIRAAQEVRHRGRAVTAEDYRDLVSGHFPVRVLEVAATSLLRRNRLRPGVRLTVVPRTWRDVAECLSDGLLLGKKIEAFLTDKSIEGVAVVAGPPSLRVDAMPRPNDPLWVYREYLTTEQVGVHAAHGGVYWSVADVHQLREACRD